jgi:hypothetical protein
MSTNLNSDALKAAAKEFVDVVDDWQQFGCTKERAAERVVAAYLDALPRQEGEVYRMDKGSYTELQSYTPKQEPSGVDMSELNRDELTSP